MPYLKLNLQVKADAEAANMNYKADAWKEFGEAAVLSMYLDTLPKVREIRVHCVILILSCLWCTTFHCYVYRFCVSSVVLLMRCDFFSRESNEIQETFYESETCTEHLYPHFIYARYFQRYIFHVIMSKDCQFSSVSFSNL